MARAVTFREAMARTSPGLTHVAWEGTHPPTGRYRPDHVELFLVTAGEGRRTVTSDDGSQRIHRMLPGKLYIFRPLDVHEIRGVGREGLSAICVAFPFETWEKFALVTEIEQNAFTRPDPPEIDVDLDDPEVLRPFRRVLDEFRVRPDAMDLIRFLADTVPWFVDAAHATERSGIPGWLWAAVTAMYEEPNLHTGVARLTELSHVSHTHLWRNTRKYLGLSPSELVNEIRVRHASLLLTSTDDPVGSIADRCGFSDASHFSKAFRRSFLVTPREYRSQSRARSRAPRGARQRSQEPLRTPALD